MKNILIIVVKIRPFFIIMGFTYFLTRSLDYVLTKIIHGDFFVNNNCKSATVSNRTIISRFFFDVKVAHHPPKLIVWGILLGFDKCRAPPYY